MKKIMKVMTFAVIVAFVLIGCSKDPVVTASVNSEKWTVGRTYLNFEISVDDPKAKDRTLTAKVNAYVYEIVKGIDDEEELSLAKSKTITKTLEEVKIEGLTELKDYRLIVKKTSGEEKELISKDFKTTDIGSAKNPIHVTTIEEFYKIDDDLGSYYILDNDLDFANYKNEKDENSISSIGSSSRQFTGTFDGNGKTIKNIKNFTYSSSVYYYGIFSTIGFQGIVKNLTLDGIHFDTKNGDKLEQKSIEYLGTIAAYNFGTIENVTIKNVDLEVGLSRSNSYVGGVAGVNDGVIRNVSVSGNLKFESASSNIYAGGICGMLAKDTDGLDRLVEKSSANITMNVKTARNSVIVGGLIGESRGDVFNSYSTGKIEARTETTLDKDFKNVMNLGGLIGKHNKGYIKNTYAEVELVGTSNFANIHIGGLFGQVSVANLITGSISKSTIKHTYDTKKNMEALVDEKLTYAVGFIYGFSESENVDNIKDCVVLNTLTYNVSNVEEASDDVLASSKLEANQLVSAGQLATKEYFISLGWTDDIWNFSNLYKMPVLK